MRRVFNAFYLRYNELKTLLFLLSEPTQISVNNLGKFSSRFLTSNWTIPISFNREEQRLFNFFFNPEIIDTFLNFC